MTPRGKFIAIVAIAVLAGSAAAYMVLDRKPATLLRPDDGSVVARGKEIYGAACASCHGANLEGQPNWRDRGPDGLLPAPPHDDTGHTWHHPDAVLFEITKFGMQKFAGPDYKSAMPAFEGRLSDDDVLAVLSFIESTWPPNIRRRHDAINQAGAD
jgi:mono/diheme cytochrome c family protein